MNKRRFTIKILAVVAIIFISYGVFLSVKPKPSHVIVLDFKAEQTGGVIFTLHFVVYGHVINDGGSNSNVVQLALIITNNQTGGVLYQTSFSPLPAILAPNEEGTFSVPFTTDDLGGYRGKFNYSVNVVSQ